MALCHECLDHGDLLRDVLDGTGLDVRRQQAEFFAIRVEFPGPTGGEIGERLAGFLGIPDRLVVHVGDVADVQRAGAAGFKRAAENVLKHEGAEIPDVRRTINGGATAIEAIGGAIERPKLALGPGQRVKKPHGGV